MIDTLVDQLRLKCGITIDDAGSKDARYDPNEDLS